MIINPVVYAELSVRFDRIEDVDATLKGAAINLLEIPTAALFLAGKAFQRYRAPGGKRNGVLPDFFIGAHAAVLRLPLLTRDISRHRAYYSTVALIAPQ